MKAIIYKNAKNQIRWRWQSANGKIPGQEKYSDVRAARRGIASIDAAAKAKP